MIGEVNVYGVFLPALLVCAAVSAIATMVVCAGLRRIGFYRLVWHPAAFDLAVFVILLGAVVALTSPF